MIPEEFRTLLEQIRQKAFETGANDLSLKLVAGLNGFSIDELRRYVQTDEELVEKILELERGKFVEIFVEQDFESLNAIDSLLIVSRELSNRFNEISPSVTFGLKEKFPLVYQHHFERRILFISDKIRINLNAGIQQGLYRSDLSTELIARLYISRLIDIHNPEFFPPEDFSFQMLFNQMFESLIRSVSTPEGLAYFEVQKEKFLL